MTFNENIIFCSGDVGSQIAYKCNKLNNIEELELMKNPRWTQEEDAYLIKNYRRRDSNWNDLLKKINHSKEAIIIRASKLGLTIKQKNWSKDEIKELKKEYPNRKVSEIAKKTDRTENAIRKILSENNIKKEIRWHKYKINANFFKKWTRESSYLLGFIAADGCINERENHYSIEISSKDKSILNKIRKMLDYTKKVEKERENFRLRVDNKVIYHDLIEKGIRPRKSKDIKFLKVPGKHLNHFIRGFFDGDGSIYKLNDGRIVVKFTCWSPQFLEELQKKLSNECIVKHKKTNDNSIVYYPKESFEIIKFLYKKSNKDIRLERKYTRAIKFSKGVISFAA